MAATEAVVGGLAVDLLKAVEEQGQTPSAEDASAARTTTLQNYEGRPAYFRLVLAGSAVAGWPRSITVGKVEMVPATGPVTAQQTYVFQQPNKNSFEKITHRYEVGHGRPLVVALRPFTLALEDIVRDMQRYRRECLAAVGFLAAILDERFAVHELAENIVVMDGAAAHPERFVDVSWRVRAYRPDVRMPESISDSSAVAPDAGVGRATRWYLKGAQEGPTAEGVVWLCAAIESLVGPPAGRKRRSFNRAALEGAVTAAGDDPQRFTPDLGRIAGLRSEVIHKGIEEPELLKDGFYVLEEIARLLIRHRLGVREAWPLRPGSSVSAQAPARMRLLANNQWVE